MGEIADALRRSGARQAFQSEPRPAERESERSPAPGAPAPTATQPLRPRDKAIVSEDGPQLEACRQLALRLRAALRRAGGRSVAVVSALRDEGKTTTSCNLALALASLEAGRRVALVGLDLRRPSAARVLGIDVSVGVEQVLAGRASVDEARVSLAEPALDVFAARAPLRAAHEVLTPAHLSSLMAALETRYETIIVDTPPVLLVPDARLILEHVPLCLPVARAGKTRVRSFREMLDALPREQVLTTLLNGGTRRGHYYVGYDYYGADEFEEDEDPEKQDG